MAIILTTPRLALREFEETEADAAHLVALNDNPNVTRYLGEGRVTVAEALDILRDRLVKQHRAHGVGRWAVERREDGRFIGWAGLKYEAEIAAYDLGYRFFERDWGQGYGREAARACLEWADRTLPGRRIIGRAHPDNLGSVRILEGLGGSHVGEEQEEHGVVKLFVLREGGRCASEDKG